MNCHYASGPPELHGKVSGGTSLAPLHLAIIAFGVLHRALE
jgi:hypothetical protein